MLKHKTVMEEVAYVEDIICNKCEKSLKDSSNINYEGLVEADVAFGYGSDHFGDMTQIQFSLCEKCLHNLVATFKISPLKEV